MILQRVRHTQKHTWSHEKHTRSKTHSQNLSPTQCLSPSHSGWYSSGLGSPLPRVSQEPRDFAGETASHRCPGPTGTKSAPGVRARPLQAGDRTTWRRRPLLTSVWHLSGIVVAFRYRRPGSPSSRANLGSCPLPLTFPYQKPDSRLQLIPRDCEEGGGRRRSWAEGGRPDSGLPALSQRHLFSVSSSL